MTTLSSIHAAIGLAARATGVDQGVLLRTAERESSLRPDAQAATSSALGLFQFVDRTWISVLKRYGEELGAGEAAALARNDATRGQALALRTDPRLSALMAGALMAENRDGLADRIGREPDDAELYAAHVLGVGGAARLIEGVENNPDQLAHDIFPAAARANRPLFFDRDGTPRSVAGLMGQLARGFGEGASPAATQTAEVPEPEVDVPLQSWSGTPVAALSGFARGHAPLVLSDMVLRTLSALTAPGDAADREQR